MPQADTNPEHYLRQFKGMVSGTIADKMRRDIRIDLWGLIGLLILTTSPR